MIGNLRLNEKELSAVVEHLYGAIMDGDFDCYADVETARGVIRKAQLVQSRMNRPKRKATEPSKEGKT